jgi:cyanophycinase
MKKQKANNGTAPKGRLVIIGGGEDKEGDKLILRTVAKDAVGALVVVTAASNKPEENWEEYERIFRDLGVDDVRHLHVDTRAEALDPARHSVLDDASVVFFTGGDQLKLASQLGDSPVFSKTREIFYQGGCVAGTSAGASIMCETMLVSGDSSQSPRVKDALRMAPGFGLVHGFIIDQHFAERGRIGRLIGAVAQNPRIVGVGIDEDTAIVCENSHFTVLGAGGVYVVDAREVTQSNVVEDAADRTLSVFDIKLHLLNMGDAFDMEARIPESRSTEDAAEELGVSLPR